MQLLSIVMKILLPQPAHDHTRYGKIIGPPFIFEIFQQRRIARLNPTSDLDSP